jgi:hypothetical protein
VVSPRVKDPGTPRKKEVIEKKESIKKIKTVDIPAITPEKLTERVPPTE